MARCGQAPSLGGQRRLEHRAYARQARRFREVAEGLGGLIIKLGQYLSVRVDMLPREYTEELSALQDSVPPVPFEDIADVFEKSVGATVGEVFATFEREPLAAASLGQVHEATLVSGQRVAVKILRPHIAETIETDLAALKTIFGMAQRYTRLGDTIDFDQLYGEFERTVSAELDLMREGRSAEAVREKLHDFPNVAVPDIHWETSSSEVLTMEYMEGVSISDIGALDAMGIDRAQLATDLIDVFAEMILYDGLFHADPHPGNVHVQAGGTIVLLDFGMMGTITDDMRKGFMGVVTAIFSRDAASPWSLGWEILASYALAQIPRASPRPSWRRWDALMWAIPTRPYLRSRTTVMSCATSCTSSRSSCPPTWRPGQGGGDRRGHMPEAQP